MATRKTANATQAPEAAAEETASAPTNQPETITLTGRLCADPVLRHTKSGKAVTTIRVAVTHGPEATFHNVVAWGRTAEVICQYLRKGRLIAAEGRTQQRSWDGEDGKSYTVTELVAWRVQFLSREKAAAETTTEQAVA